MYLIWVVDCSGICRNLEPDRWWTSKLDCWSRKYASNPRVILAFAMLPRRHWLWHIIVPESCWRWCCRVMLVMALSSDAGDGTTAATLAIVRCHFQVMLTMALPSLASDDAAEAMLAVVWCCYRCDIGSGVADDHANVTRGTQPVGRQPGRGRHNRLLAQRSCWPQVGFRPSTVPGVLNVFPFVLIPRK
jgi:hypothetical protein